MRVAHALLALFLLPSLTPAADHPTTDWAHPGPTGKLTYKTTDHGDRILDFSHAGYMGGGVALPDVPVKITLKPTGQDDTAAIQSAIDQVSSLPLTGDHRGAILLSPGTFTCNQTLRLATSGIVLRGSGSGPNGTTVRMTGQRHTAITIASDRPTPPPPDEHHHSTHITDPYVPAGATSFSVQSPAGLSPGDTIAIRRPITQPWVHLMQMDTLTRDGKPQTWLATNRAATQERKITRIDQNRITLDVPLADSYDAQYLNPPGTRVEKVTPAPRTSQVGVEHLHIQCPPIESAYGRHPYSALRIAGEDCWVRDVRCEETMNTTVLTGRRITLQNVHVTHTHPNLGASKPADFSIEGSQILIDRCSSVGGNTYWVWTSSLVHGPNVVLNSLFRGHGSRIQPHHRWATALLVDNCTAPDGGIDFMNRGVAGSGHGWTIGWAVAWNCNADFFTIQNPPGTHNWAIGCVGRRERIPRLFDTAPIQPDGTFDSHGTPVSPQSLYLAQLADRLGPHSLANIGYPSNSPDQFPSKSTPRLPPLPRADHPDLGPDLALHRPIDGPDGPGETREFSPERAIDAHANTYWAATPSDSRPTLTIDTEGPLPINSILLEEPPQFAGRIRQYKLEAQVDSDWLTLAQGTTLNPRQLHRFPPTTAWKVRLTIEQSEGPPALQKFSLYHTP